MNLKKKIFGVAAASIFALSMSAGIASADQASVAVNLNPGVCSASITESHFSFGDWTWDDEAQAYVGGVDSTDFEASVRVPYSGATCPVLIKLDGHKLNGANPGNSILGSDLTVAFASGPLAGYSGPLNQNWTFTAPHADITGDITLDLEDKTHMPDRYTGTIIFQINNGN